VDPVRPRPIAIIRNEELILIRAEANNNKTARDAAAAAADINFIRVNSGGLAANGGLGAATQQAVEDEILIQRKYSLLYEGMRWVDMRAPAVSTRSSSTFRRRTRDSVRCQSTRSRWMPSPSRRHLGS
jgi:hypothetical protein